MTNLRNSFPEKAEQELEKIKGDFYKFLCDLILETIKMTTISREDIAKRCKFKNMEVFDLQYKNNKSVIAVMGHYGNWEWANASMSLFSKYQLNAIYKPLSNQRFDSFFKRIRSRFGASLVPMNSVPRSFVENRNKLTTTAFLSDQTAGPDHSYWITFLNQDTTVFPGAEKLARKYNYPVIFCSVDRVKRGFYEINAELLFDNPGTTSPQEISICHTQKLESEIIRKPEIWLWSHRKWKHKKPTSIEP